ncbi:hypothetical protein G7067_13255 [Leucobacter insecticola]|uniref:Uncharacterized protein n=1 Tax=Leucobacter insecticola TaxID=2714934 RepID=A0A6G8FLA6_9MICO|nr:hypothetical protein [Leucobacter insecticola]QIM17157.1 hypothetical protein G7067_13255 [Leucobacter insecticola]
MEPQLPTGTVIYQNVPAQRSLADELLDEREVDEGRWNAYEQALVHLAAFSTLDESAWSFDQIERTQRYINMHESGDLLASLAKTILNEVRAQEPQGDANGVISLRAISPGVPIGLGRILLDPQDQGVILSPLGPVASRMSTAARLVEELVWLASVVRPMNDTKAEHALRLAKAVSDATGKVHSRALQLSTLLSFVAHVQRRLSAPLAPPETVEVFMPSILQVIKNPSALGLPWEQLT